MRPAVRTTRPVVAIVRVPASGKVIVRVGGSERNETTRPRNGSGASLTGGPLSIPFGIPFSQRSNQAALSANTIAASGPGKREGECPNAPM